MDIVTQGIAGATCAQAFANRRNGRMAALVGLSAGLLPDADALIYSVEDPLVQLEFHRHFSHALVFIPVGAGVAALLFWLLLRRSFSFNQLYLFAICGYAPGGLLDACTSYGTHLFWPFVQQPVAWNAIAIVDPVFTLMLAVPLAIGLRRCRPMRIGLVLALVYLLLGAMQHERAEFEARKMAGERRHEPQRLLVKPTVGNLILWRSIYIFEDSVRVDGVRVGLGVRIYPGEQRLLFEPERDLGRATSGSRTYRDAVRFGEFARGFVVRYPEEGMQIGDARYAMLPTAIEPLWGMEFDPDDPEAAPSWITSRSLTADTRRRFFDMLLGRKLGE